jgi:PKHD-type hydroxylase
MEYKILQPQYTPLYCWWQDTFSDAEIDSIVKLGIAQGLEESTINSGGNTSNQIVNLETRTCKINWMYNIPEYKWIFERIEKTLITLNNQYYKYIVDQFEPFQFTSYNSSRKEFYGKHTDCSLGAMDPSTSRKLSVTLQLSDPDDYEGGDLLLHNGMTPEVAPKKKGMMILFPSFVLHEVTPVTAGQRYSLVTWAHGPLFK